MEFADVDVLGTSADVGESGVVARSLEAGVGREVSLDRWGEGGPGCGAVRGEMYASALSCIALCGGETVMMGRTDDRLSVLRRADSNEPFCFRACTADWAACREVRGFGGGEVVSSREGTEPGGR